VEHAGDGDGVLDGALRLPVHVAAEARLEPAVRGAGLRPQQDVKIDGHRGAAGHDQRGRGRELVLVQPEVFIVGHVELDGFRLRVELAVQRAFEVACARHDGRVDPLVQPRGVGKVEGPLHVGASAVGNFGDRHRHCFPDRARSGCVFSYGVSIADQPPRTVCPPNWQ
jgi:hypothetical protein